MAGSSLIDGSRLAELCVCSANLTTLVRRPIFDLESHQQNISNPRHDHVFEGAGADGVDRRAGVQ
jgi:hypothetical protein